MIPCERYGNRPAGGGYAAKAIALRLHLQNSSASATLLFLLRWARSVVSHRGAERGAGSDHTRSQADEYRHSMSEPSDSTIPKSPRRFRTTHWSLVLSASADSREALEELCTAYWPPLYWHLRRLGHDATQAEDLTQAFFARLLDKRLLDFADRRRGRFRTFLLTALRRFVVNEWKHEGAAKRGGGMRRLALDSGRADQLLAAEASHDITPDRLFERQWALVLLQRAFGELESEQRAAGKAVLFEALAPCLTGDASTPGYDEMADRLQSTPAALRMAVSRLRKRLGELIRAEIRKTVGSDADVDDELRNLFRALRT